jgi:hypothetical protein
MVTVRLGEFLVQNHYITEEQLNDALTAQKSEPTKKIGEILLDKKLIKPEAIEEYFKEIGS